MELPKAKASLRSTSSPLSRVEFHFNPTTITFGRSAKYAPGPPVGGASHGQYTGTEATSLKLQVLLDAVEKQPSGSVMPEVERILGWLRPENGVTGSGASPPKLIFEWGALTIDHANPFEGYLESVNVTYELFARDGRPLRAQLDLSLMAVTARTLGTNPTSGSERTRRRHVLKTGETLHGVAFSVYSDPAAWRAIAVVNGIDDPTRLSIGSELLLPDAYELVEVLR